MPFRKRIAAVFAAAVLPLAACDDGSMGNSSVTLLLTDAPGDFHAAVVTITDIWLQGEEDSESVVILEEDATFDLLSLRNDIAELVDDVTIPDGTYSQLRVRIAGAYVEVEEEDGSTTVYATPGYDQVPAELAVDGVLLCPSCAQSGLKFVLPGGALEFEGDSRVLLLDFDVAESFGHQAGNSGMWVMHPVVHITEVQSAGEIAVSAQLADGVTLPVIGDTQVTLASFSAQLTDDEGNDEGSVALADTDGDGIFTATFLFVVPDAYTVTLTGPEGVTFTPDPASVTVTVGSGATAAAGFTITAAS